MFTFLTCNSKIFTVSISGIISLFLLAFPPFVGAVTSIAVDGGNSKYGYCTNKANPAEAEKCAIEKCGDFCKVAKTCEEAGYGAVHQNFLSSHGDQKGATTSVIGFACGKEFPAFASNASLSRCKKENRKLNKQAFSNICFEKALWQDQPLTTESKEENWCSYATEVTGIKNFEECVESSRFMNPEKDCAKNVKLWCR
jgi:hypothetical protein